MVTKRRAPFKDTFVLEFGLRVQERDPATLEVLTATCMFCELFGREGKAGAHRRVLSKVAVLKPPFRKDAIRQHLTGQHARQWEDFCKLDSDDSRRAFFTAAGATEIGPDEGRKTPRTSVNTQSRPVQSQCRRPANRPIAHLLIDRDIVEVMLGKLLPYAAEISTGQRFLSGFEDTVDTSETTREGVDLVTSTYRIVVDDILEFQRFADFLSTTGSMEHTNRMLFATSQTGVSRDDGGMVEGVKVARYARYLCAINLQRIAEIAKSSWAYSILLEVTPAAPVSFFETQREFCLHLQLRLFVSGEVVNCHVLSIPLSKRRQSDPDESASVFEIAETALDAITPNWRDAIIAVILDGGPVPVDDPQLSILTGVVNSFERAAKPGFFRQSCATRQLDSAMHTFFTKLLGGGNFQSELSTLFAYLSRQRQLLKAMQTKIPRVGDMRWQSMAVVLMWLRRHAVTIRTHLAREQVSCAPSDLWWMYITIAAPIAQEASVAELGTSGLTVHTVDLQDSIVKLQSFTANWFQISSSPEGGDLTATSRESTVVSKDGKYFVKKVNVVEALMDLGTFVADTLQASESDGSTVETINNVASSVVNLVSRLALIPDGADRIKLPAVLPHELVKIRGRQFSEVIRSQMERLLSTGWSKQEIEWIEQDFQDLRGAFFRESSLKEALHRCPSNTSFQTGWSCVQGRFTRLKRFCGAMTTAFPRGSATPDGTASSGLQPWWDDANEGLPGDVELGVSDLSVQAALQASQFRRLQSIEL